MRALSGWGEVIRIESGCGRCMTTGERLIGRKVDSRATQQGGPKHSNGNRARLNLLLQNCGHKKDQDVDGRSGKTTLKPPPGIRI